MIHDRELLRQNCLEVAFKELTQAMNSIYVKQTITNASRAREDVEQLFALIKQSFIGRLHNITWVDDETRANAIHKVRKK